MKILADTIRNCKRTALAIIDNGKPMLTGVEIIPADFDEGWPETLLVPERWRAEVVDAIRERADVVGSNLLSEMVCEERWKEAAAIAVSAEAYARSRGNHVAADASFDVADLARALAEAADAHKS